MSQALHRPSPVDPSRARAVAPDEEPERIARSLRRGEQRLLSTDYAHAADALDALRDLLPPAPRTASYEARQSAEQRFREAALHLLVPVRNHQLDLRGSEPIAMLAELYPERTDFTLPFVRVQELYGASRSYVEGRHLAVLGRRLHPFYGTYLPTRTEHLELFATWLARYDGPKVQATDVGTGSGVLALMLLRTGFSTVWATDLNPNAVESVRRERERLDPVPDLRPVCGDLLAEAPADELIVFNPPWMQGAPGSLVDRALYYEDGLFERFFDQLDARLGADGRAVIVFSNVLRLVQPDVPHPLDEELKRGRFVLEDKLQRRVKPTPPARRTKEKVELWVLRRA